MGLGALDRIEQNHVRVPHFILYDCELNSTDDLESYRSTVMAMARSRRFRSHLESPRRYNGQY